VIGVLAAAMGAMRERLDGREHLEQTVRALTHELKSPMSAIAAAAELLHDDLPQADRQAFAGDIQDQVNRQRNLVERMLELSKLEHRRTLDHAGPLDLAALVARVAERAELRARQRGVSLQWQRRDELTVEGDPETLELAVSNLVDNAIDFSAEGSAVVLDVFGDAEGAHVAVLDCGCGLEDFALARLGERFFSTQRPARAGEPARKGSGLGLAIVREVMALHGGHMRFAHRHPGLQAELVLPLR
jgi:two-component system, OmpR family, sensor histidine kinase CreC